MSTTTSQLPRIFGDAGQSTGAFKKFSAEVAAFFGAVLNPRKAIGEVEQMLALYRQADKLEASDPAAAAVLRQRAGRIGL